MVEQQTFNLLVPGSSPGGPATFGCDMKIYKIRKKGTTDTFSSGGAYPRWTKKGRTWGSLSHITTHLGPRNLAFYVDAEIVVFTVVEDDVLEIAKVNKQTQDRKDKIAKDQQAKRDLQHENYEREQLRALQAKYPQ